MLKTPKFERCLSIKEEAKGSSESELRRKLKNPKYEGHLFVKEEAMGSSEMVDEKESGRRPSKSQSSS
jgi:hypothetical protein